MLKVWFVIYSGMFIAGSVGPMPYNMQVCQIEARAKASEIKTAIRTARAYDGRKISKNERQELLDIRYGCIEAEERPVKDLPS